MGAIKRSELLLINKELIQKAKERLGNENAKIIAELLELDDYDESNMKACCPYHHEDTASFIYNSKDFRFHCFGCGHSVDIIDVLMEKGNTFIDSVKWLMEKVDIDFSCPEQHVKTIERYKYPHEEDINNEMTQVYEYLESRGISKRVVDYLDIRADKHGNICFNTYDQYDTLSVVNYRKSRKVEKGENKCWFQKDADTADLLWNMNRVNTTKPLVITEGQIDCASVVQAGYLNCVSILKGCQGMGWIEYCWDWLQQFDSIIIFSDGDAPGTKMRNDVINRLGAMRCKYVDVPSHLEYKDTGRIVPVKDASEILQCRGEEFLLNLINEAKDIPITSVAKLSEIEELDPHNMEGFKTGLKGLDDELMKIFVGGVTLITGMPSAGKTTFLNEVALMSMDNGFPVFLFSRELLNGLSVGWLNNVAAGRRNMRKIQLRDEKAFYVVNDDAKKKIKEHYNSDFYVYKDEEGNDVESLLTSMEMCACKKGVKTFIIDNLMTVQLDCDEQGMNKAQTDFITRLIKFSMQYDVAVVVVAHPRKMPSGQEIGMFDVAGSSNIVNLATRTISLRRIKDKDKEDVKYKYYGYDVVISIVKDRIFGSTKEIPVYYDKISRRFFSNYEEFDRAYGWCDEVYATKIPYPIEEREQFPDK